MLCAAAHHSNNRKSIQTHKCAKLLAENGGETERLWYKINHYYFDCTSCKAVVECETNNIELEMSLTGPL